MNVKEGKKFVWVDTCAEVLWLRDKKKVVKREDAEDLELGSDVTLAGLELSG